jgi:tetratricopeptide (TPR) repeat protein
MLGPVFVCYARADGEDFANRLHDSLEADHIDAWLDTHDICEGCDWDAEISKALESSVAVVVVLTPGAVLSMQVKSEWQEALSRKLPVIPLLVKDCQIPRVLGVLNYIDFRKSYDLGIALLRRRLHEMDANHLAYLKSLLSAFEVAQQDAPDPRRFQSKIEDLRSIIENWQQRLEVQYKRIGDGLEERREEVAREHENRRNQLRQRIVGQRPINARNIFQNRLAERKRLEQLLAEPSTSIVSVIGRAGIGKTALAGKVLSDLEHDRWPHTDEEKRVDGIIYLSTRITGITLERLFLSCARMLGGDQERMLHAIWIDPQMGIEEKVSRLLDTLTNGLYIILMDNIDDLLDKDGQLIDKDLQSFFETSLVTPHNLRLLVTSRIPLAFRQKALQFDKRVTLREGLPVLDGITMLRELDPNGTYSLREAQDEKLAQIVQRVHGVPRALEIFASILANDPFATVDDLLSQFYKQEDVVRDLIEEGYKRLDKDARCIVEALAVFGCPVPQLAVDFLLEPFVPGLDVPGLVRRLAHTHMISIDRSSKTIILHPVDCDYAYSRLLEDEDGTYNRRALERRAADYYVQLRTLSRTWQTISDLEPQLLEFEHRVKAEDYDIAVRLVDDIDSSYLSLWGHARRVLSMREQLLGKIIDTRLEGKNLGYLGLANHTLGQFEQAIACHERALAIAREMGDRYGEETWLGNLGRAYRNLGRYENAVESLQQAIIIAQEVGNSRSEAVHLDNLGLTYFDLGQVEQAVACAQKARNIAHEIGEQHFLARYLGNLGNAYRVLGRLEQAADLCSQSLRIARENKDQRNEAIWLGNLANAYGNLGLVEKAVELYQQALEIVSEIGDRRLKGALLRDLGSDYIKQLKYQPSIECLQEAILLATEIGDPRLRSYAGGYLARAWLHTEHLSDALETITATQQYSCPTNDHHVSALHGLILLRLRKKEEARVLFQESLDYADVLLAKTPDYFAAKYTRGLALSGLALLARGEERASLLAQAQHAYLVAVDNCNGKGVVMDTLHLLNELQLLSKERVLVPLKRILTGKDRHDSRSSSE